MIRLSSSLGDLKAHYDVVVVGSGYGGAITAARLSGTVKGDGSEVSVCVLERGEELHPGEYPGRLHRALQRFQVHVGGKRFGSATGLYEFRLGRDLNVVQGCGLGGGSLINANAVVAPTKEVLDDRVWPDALRARARAKKWYTLPFLKVRRALRAVPYAAEELREGDPKQWPRLAKLEALRKSSKDFANAEFGRPALAVTFHPYRDGHTGVLQRSCTLCGDCVSGCNYGSKNTLLMNYLPHARRRGSEIFSEVRVRRIERIPAPPGTELQGQAKPFDDKRDPTGPGRWLLRIEPLNTRREAYDSPDLFVTADVVVLAAGSLGSTEILLRSSTLNGGDLALPPSLGTRFSGNGDVIAFGYNNDEPIVAFGAGARLVQERRATGPTITGMMDLRDGRALADQTIIQEGVIPGAVASPMRLVLPFFSWLLGKDTDRGFRDRIGELWRELVSVVRGAYHGALRHTQTYLVMGHDGSKGRLALWQDRLRVQWRDLGESEYFQKVNSDLLKATKTLGGTHVINPFWSARLGRRTTTVHPLGGCPMADSPDRGVVNHAGRVFRPDANDPEDGPFHEGLYVADGAIIPRSLGANPLLTISALADRNAQLLIKQRGWKQRVLTKAKQVPGQTARLGLRFSERLRGWIEPHPGAPTALSGGGLEAVLTVESDNLDEMSRDGNHVAKLYGTILWPCQYGAESLTATGTFQLFAHDPDRVETRRMRYEMTWRSKSGDEYHFSGRKTIFNNPNAIDVWHDVTRLAFDLKQGGRPVGRGRMRLPGADLYRLISSARVTGATSVRQSVFGRLRFVRFYIKTIISQFAWLVRPSDVADPYERETRIPYLRRPSRTHLIRTGDGAGITLTRHNKRGGRKGPVVLAPGFGTSTIAFVMSTNDRFKTKDGACVVPDNPIRFVDEEGGIQIRRSFTDFLVEKGYDVWLLDYRVSELSEASGTQFTMDDIAKYDWPAAVQEVLRTRNREEETAEFGRTESVQLLGHCVGSATLLMSLLGGHLKDSQVRSVICSQALTHLDQPVVNRLKARVRLASMFHRIGSWPTFNPDFDVRSGYFHRWLDLLLRLHPGERCRNPVCRRIHFLYGGVNRHEQLNAGTHDAMHEMFNEANVTTFEHLSALIREGCLVNAKGEHTYLTPEAIANMRLPVGLMQGEANQIFRKRGLHWSYDWLRNTALGEDLDVREGLQHGHLHGPEGSLPGLYNKMFIQGTTTGQDSPGRDRYGHMDCFIGRDPWHDVFEKIHEELQRGDRVAAYLTRHTDDVAASVDEGWTVPSPLLYPS